jgi:hypothetical protein
MTFLKVERLNFDEIAAFLGMSRETFSFLGNCPKFYEILGKSIFLWIFKNY